ncbi:MAG: MFS transporter [Fibrobacteria bacterium]|nr:MFS transporter [Fibrobacteria bacterium]
MPLMPFRLSFVFLLGISSGLPLFLTTKTLQAWLTSAKVDLGTIGLLSLVSLPYSFKFLWAPLMDRFTLPFLGRRRGWIALTQALLALAVALMALSDPAHALTAIASCAVLVAFLSASQDIVFDAWRTDVLPPAERGPGAALGVLGYRVALLLTGSLALILADHLSWKLIYLFLALIQALLILATLLAPEPETPPAAPHTLEEAVVRPFVEFFRSRGMLLASASLAFVVLFKWGVYLVQTMSTPFLLELGFSQSQVGTVLGGAGLVATIAGTAAGGAVMTKLPVFRALWTFGILQGICGLLFWGLALHGDNLTWMTAAVVAENFFIGMGTAALVAWLMGECDPRFSATQFALLSSLMAVGRDLLTSPAGYVAKAVGWPTFFLLTLLACLPGLALLTLLQHRTPKAT